MKAKQPVNAQLYCSDAIKLCIDGLQYFIIHGTLLQDTKAIIYTGFNHLT